MYLKTYLCNSTSPYRFLVELLEDLIEGTLENAFDYILGMTEGMSFTV